MTLYSEKIKLVPIKESDTPLIIKWRNTESVQRNFIFQEPFTEEMHKNWLNTKVASGEVVQFIIYEKDSDKAIGSVYLRDIDDKNKKAEYGIFIGEEMARGKGYGKESAELICKYAFKELGLHKIMLRVFADNLQAIHSYLKAGFEKEALLRDEIRQQEGYRDIILMAKFEE